MSARLLPAEVRALFPAVVRASYLNAAAASPICLPVERANTEHYREALEWGDIGWSAWLKRKEEIRAELARFIGASAREVAFLGSTSMGFNAVARWLVFRGVREVVTLAQEFPSTTVPLLHAGLTLRVVAPRDDGSYPVEDIEAALTRRTGAVALSLVQYASGFRADLTAIGRLCLARRLLLAVNGAQALGQVPLDVKAQHVDFLCATSHKWMMGGYGTGLFYVRAGLLDSLPFAGWLSTDDAMQMQPFPGSARRGKGVFTARGVKLRQRASSLEVGCGPYGALFGFGAALELLRRVGIARIEKHNLSLQRHLREELASRGFAPNAPLGSGICVFRIHGSPHRAAAELAKKGVVVSARGGGLRVSTHVFNDEEDLEQLFWAMDRLRLRPAS